MQAMHESNQLIEPCKPPAVFHKMVKEESFFLGKRKPWYGLELPDGSFRRVIGNGFGVRVVKEIC
jgi:hypothetical protein